MQRSFGSPTVLSIVRAPIRRSGCGIVCQGCGASAEIELEVLPPAALRLRCLSCSGDHIVVAEERGVETSRIADERPIGVDTTRPRGI